MSKRVVFSALVFVVSMINLSATVLAMPKLSDGSLQEVQINALIEKQTDAYRSAKYADALKFNGLIKTALKNRGKQASLEQTQATFDNSLILYHLGKKSAALAMMKQLQTSGRIDQLSKEYRSVGNNTMHYKMPLLDYFIFVNHTFLEWMREAKDPALPATLTKFVNEVEASSNFGVPPVSRAGIISYALGLRKDMGDLAGARAICNRNIEWLQSINGRNVQYTMGYRQTVFVDGDYIYDWAFKSAKFSNEYNYALAEGYDDCAGLAEIEGVGELALNERKLSRLYIMQSDQKQFVGLIDMRIGRLLAMLGKSDDAVSYLRRAWEGEGDAAQRPDASMRSLLCERLPFSWQGNTLTVGEVRAAWATQPTLAPIADLYDCGTAGG
jgi:hypothetical protein